MTEKEAILKLKTAMLNTLWEDHRNTDSVKRAGIIKLEIDEIVSEWSIEDLTSHLDGNHFFPPDTAENVQDATYYVVQALMKEK